MYEQFEQLKRSNGNPLDFFNQITSQYTPEQMQVIFSKAKELGVPDDYLKQVQNGINSNE